jgi:hypothetical protein
MAAQGVITLRPRKMIELFDQAIRLYRSNFLKFIGIIAIAEVPAQVLGLGINLLVYGNLNRSTSTYSDSTLDLLGPTMLLSLFSLAVNLVLITGLASAALTTAITSSYLGETVTIGGAYSKIRNSWWRLLLSILLLTLISIGFSIWAIIPCVGWLTGIGILVTIIMVVTPLIAPIVIIENRSGGSAIRRGWDLVRRRFWWLFGYFLLLFIFNLLVIQGPVQIVSTLLQGRLASVITASQSASTDTIQLVASSITSLLLSLLYIPLQSACATLVYFDLRIRQEGFDLALMANQGSETPLKPVELAGQSTVKAGGPLVTWNEVGYFVLVSLIGAGFYAVFILLITAGLLMIGSAY